MINAITTCTQSDACRGCSRSGACRLPRRGITFEIGAGQVVEQYIVPGLEQIPPALRQKTEQIASCAPAACPGSDTASALHQGIALAQQLAHRTVPIPLPMQPPFAARIHQPIAHQGLQHVQPIVSPHGSPAAARARSRPTATAAIARRPASMLPIAAAGAAAARPSRTWTTSCASSGASRSSGNRPPVARCPPPSFEHLDALAPGRFLAVIDLSQVQHLSLYHCLPSAHGDSRRCSSSDGLCRPSFAAYSGETCRHCARPHGQIKRVGLHYSRFGENLC